MIRKNSLSKTMKKTRNKIPILKTLFIQHAFLQICKTNLRDFTRLSISCNKLSILSAHTTDELYATKKDIRTFNDQPLFKTANKIQLYFDEASRNSNYFSYCLSVIHCSSGQS